MRVQWPILQRLRVFVPAYRLALAGLVCSALLVQFLNGLGRTDFSPVNFFSFFTIESNIFASLVFLAAVLPPRRTDSGPFAMMRGAATVYMVTTGIVYALLLSGLEESLQTPLPLGQPGAALHHAGWGGSRLVD